VANPEGKLNSVAEPTERFSADNGSWSTVRTAVVLVGVIAIVFAVYNIVALFSGNRPDPRYTPQRTVNLDEPDKPADIDANGEASEQSSVRIAIAPVISPEKSLTLYRKFVDYVADKMGKTPVCLQRDTYLEVNDLIRFGRCDMAMVCTYAFVRGEKEFGMEALVVPQINGTTTYHSLILVPPSSSAESLLNLRRTRFGSADILSNSGWLYPATWLEERGEDPNTFFKEHVITGSHDRSVTAVASGFVDGAAVDSLVYEHLVEEDASLKNRTRIILKSPPFGMPPLVVPRQIDPQRKEELREILVTMHTDPEGKKILRTLHIEKFVVPDEGLFDSVRQAAESFEVRK
jgi:phosphonate transport system substrate-binding protein